MVRGEDALFSHFFLKVILGSLIAEGQILIKAVKYLQLQ